LYYRFVITLPTDNGTFPTRRPVEAHAIIHRSQGHAPGGTFMHDLRSGAKQPHPFDPARAALLDDYSRFEYLPPAALIALLDLNVADTLVDFGTGTGTYAIEIARARPDLQILAFDENETMLARTQEKVHSANVPNVTAVSPSDLDSVRGRIDRILALNVLHELGDHVLVELRSLLKPHGRALVVDWNSDVDRPHGPPREHTYGVDEARQRLSASGFTVIALTTFPYHYAIVVAPFPVS
jgi:SAM-dependent methyltransferase